MCNEATGLSVPDHYSLSHLHMIFSLNSISSCFPEHRGSVSLGVHGGLSTSNQSELRASHGLATAVASQIVPDT